MSTDGQGTHQTAKKNCRKFQKGARTLRYRRQTDDKRQTDDRRTGDSLYSKREREFTFAKKRSVWRGSVRYVMSAMYFPNVYLFDFSTVVAMTVMS